MAKPGSVIGWKLDRSERAALLERFPPRYADAVADHVTLATNAERKPLPDDVSARIVGRADDGDGVEAMVVALDGSTDRPDGSTFHITWSLAPGRRARESNDVLKERGWDALDQPVPVTVEPARF
ncbi:MAG TPA: hypothetical protein VM326_05740 [Sphingomicrobium sp.]|jgi:hypothetical protein|nr:hypothetical protein [Sphingomicrobium sp.]